MDYSQYIPSLSAFGLSINTTLLTNYTSGQKAALLKYATEPDEKTYLLFIVPGNAGNVAGFMPLNRSAGFIYINGQSTDQINQTIAHELGHGAFGLDHVGKAADNAAASTDNLMDYSNSTALDKPQWDKMHSEYRRITWFQDAEEGMWTTDGHYYAVQLLALMMGLDNENAIKYGKAAEEPDTHIFSDINQEENDTWIRSTLQERFHALSGGYHGVELAVTSYALTKTHTDNASFNYLIHRFGDCFAHFNINFDSYGLSTSVKLKDYILAIDRYVDKSFDFNPENSKFLTENNNISIFAQLPNGKIHTALSRNDLVFQLIDYLLTAEHFTVLTLTIDESYFATKSLSSHWDGIYQELPPAIQNRFVMYGSDEQIGCFTFGHSMDHSKPDNIAGRSNLFLFYIKMLTELIVEKEKIELGTKATEIQGKFADIIKYVEISNILKDNDISRLDGILNFEIMRYKKPNADTIKFQIPIKYINTDNLNLGGLAYVYLPSDDQFNPDDTAQKIKEDTEKYFSIIDLNKTYKIKCFTKVDATRKIYFWEFTLTKIK